MMRLEIVRILTLQCIFYTVTWSASTDDVGIPFAAEIGPEAVGVVLPYTFHYNAPLHDGGGSSREENMDDNGVVRGSYTVLHPEGYQRIVTYIADENGFRAQVQSNEPGVSNRGNVFHPAAPLPPPPGPTSGHHPPPPPPQPNDDRGPLVQPPRYNTATVTARVGRGETVAESPVLRLNRPRLPPLPVPPNSLGDEPTFRHGPVPPVHRNPNPYREQVAHSPTLYFNTPIKEEEGGTIITRPQVQPLPAGGFDGTPQLPNQDVSPRFREFYTPPQQQQPRFIVPVPRVPGDAYSQSPQLMSFNVLQRREGRLIDVTDQMINNVQPGNTFYRPYDFNYGNQNTGTRSESRDQDGRVRGTYAFQTPDGQRRQVDYEANRDGFNARVNTNEPGVINQNPANVSYNSNGIPPLTVGDIHISKPERPLESGHQAPIYVGDDFNRHGFLEPQQPLYPRPRNEFGYPGEATVNGNDVDAPRLRFDFGENIQRPPNDANVPFVISTPNGVLVRTPHLTTTPQPSQQPDINNKFNNDDNREQFEQQQQQQRSNSQQQQQQQHHRFGQQQQQRPYSGQPQQFPQEPYQNQPGQQHHQYPQNQQPLQQNDYRSNQFNEPNNNQQNEHTNTAKLDQKNLQHIPQPFEPLEPQNVARPEDDKKKKLQPPLIPAPFLPVEALDGPQQQPARSGHAIQDDQETFDLKTPPEGHFTPRGLAVPVYFNPNVPQHPAVNEFGPPPLQPQEPFDLQPPTDPQQQLPQPGTFARGGHAKDRSDFPRREPVFDDTPPNLQNVGNVPQPNSPNQGPPVYPDDRPSFVYVPGQNYDGTSEARPKLVEPEYEPILRNGEFGKRLNYIPGDMIRRVHDPNFGVQARTSYRNGDSLMRPQFVEMSFKRQPEIPNLYDETAPNLKEAPNQNFQPTLMYSNLNRINGPQNDIQPALMYSNVEPMQDNQYQKPRRFRKVVKIRRPLYSNPGEQATPGDNDEKLTEKAMVLPIRYNRDENKYGAGKLDPRTIPNSNQPRIPEDRITRRRLYADDNNDNGDYDQPVPKFGARISGLHRDMLDPVQVRFRNYPSNPFNDVSNDRDARPVSPVYPLPPAPPPSFNYVPKFKTPYDRNQNDESRPVLPVFRQQQVNNQYSDQNLKNDPVEIDRAPETETDENGLVIPRRYNPTDQPQPVPENEAVNQQRPFPRRRVKIVARRPDRDFNSRYIPPRIDEPPPPPYFRQGNQNPDGLDAVVYGPDPSVQSDNSDTTEPKFEPQFVQPVLPGQQVLPFQPVIPVQPISTARLVEPVLQVKREEPRIQQRSQFETNPRQQRVYRGPPAAEQPESIYNDNPETFNRPGPYSFQYVADHEAGGRQTRKEESDGSGKVSGFYTIQDPDGRQRIVHYVADENGFRAKVVTNELGTDNQDAAAVKFRSTNPDTVPKNEQVAAGSEKVLTVVKTSTPGKNSTAIPDATTTEESVTAKS